MDKMKWIIFSVVVLAIFGAIIWFNRSENATFAGDAGKIIYDAPVVDHFIGPEDQKLVLIEYGDFQCPGCAAMHPAIKELEAKYPDKLTFIFRNRPLTNIHSNALAASTAAEAAGLQGMFFQMHDLLYANQDSWSNAKTNQRAAFFEAYATQLGLDVNKFRQDLKSQEVSTKLARDRMTSRNYKVDSTPTFILNGQKVTQPIKQPEDLLKLIDDTVAQTFPEEQNNPGSTEVISD